MQRNQRRREEQQKMQLVQGKSYIESIKQFLSTFKTQVCRLEQEHDLNLCDSYHGNDSRRNPYLDHSFSYYPTLEMLQDAKLDKTQNKEKGLCINQIQVLYHPILYKTQQCDNFYHCTLKLHCPHLHAQDQKAFQYGEFFRFDISTHKTKLCPRRDCHQRKTCVYYHNQTDKRRPNFQTYSHELCQKPKCNNQQCEYSHNKIQQVYHPSRFKSKFCKSYTNKNLKCQYKQFCAFAHTQGEIKIQMIHLLNKDYQFFLQKYKTVWCPNTFAHDRSVCVYAHNMQDFRRNPFKYNYQAKKCQFWSFEDGLKSIDDSGCKNGMNCDKCHGWIQDKFHPQVFKKNKESQMREGSIIEKKMINSQKLSKDNKDKVSKISKVVDEKFQEISKNNQQSSGIRDLGAPFFKKQATSESSRKTVAMTTNLTTNIESDQSIREQTTQQTQINQINDYSTKRKKSMFLFSEDEIWKNNLDDQSWIDKKIDEERAKSDNKFDDCQTVYSHSLKQVLVSVIKAVGDNSILRKLKNNNIHQIRLKNLSQSDISELMFLTTQEKDQLSHKIKVYQLRRERNPIIYNFQLTKFFIRKKKENLLEKTKNKKIKEEKLLNLRAKDLSKFEFLTQVERKQLQTLLNEYKNLRNEEEFRQINKEITRFVSPKRESHLT